MQRVRMMALATEIALESSKRSTEPLEAMFQAPHVERMWVTRPAVAVISGGEAGVAATHVAVRRMISGRRAGWLMDRRACFGIGSGVQRVRSIGTYVVSQLCHGVGVELQHKNM